MFTIHPGLPEGSYDLAAALYWEAFGEKLGIVMGPRKKGLAFVRRVIEPSHAISAIAPDGTLLGVAGFKTPKGALVGGNFQDLAAIYGTGSAIWRAILLSLLDRDIENKRFLMDGIFVTATARGQGVGTALLNAVKQAGRDRGYEAIRLDVIDTNPRAHALYLRHGFRELKTQTMGPLRHIFKFKSATTMICPL